MKKNIKNSSVLIALMISTFFPLFAQGGAYQKETKAEKAARMQWYEAARFGMFIHWGAYSQLDGEYKGKKQIDPKGEWIMRHLEIPVNEYATEIAGKFNPQLFDADKWAKAAHDAGMKYLVITTKHHDGFALFDSKTSSYNIVEASPFGRDVVKEIAEACKQYGLKLGVYYSQAQDWYHPGGLAPENRWDKAQEGEWTDYFRTIVKGQVTELFSNYGEVSLIWWDSGRAAQNKAVADEVGSELVRLQPDIIVNPRLGGKLEGDFNTFEQVIPGVLRQDYNELCITHNRSWSYKPSDNNWKTPDFLLKTMVDMVSLGGNFLFNVGPQPDGDFPPESYAALRYIGDWMQVNGEAIYETDKSPFYKLDFGKATIKTQGDKTKLYLCVYDWPEHQQLLVKGLHNKVSKAYTLDGKRRLSTSATKEGVKVGNLPKAAPHEAVSVVVLEIEEPLKLKAGYVEMDEGTAELTPLNALLTIKPQFDHIPEIVQNEKQVYFDNWKNNYPHPRFLNTGNQAHWKINVPQSASFEVWAEVATQNDNNIVTLQGNNKIKTQLPDTGGMEHFKKIHLGELKLKKGLQTITFTGGGKDEVWDFVRLGKITLTKK